MRCFFWSIISFRRRFSASLFFSFVLSPRLSRIGFVWLYFWCCLFNSFIWCSIHSCGENTVLFPDNKRITLTRLFDFPGFTQSLTRSCQSGSFVQLGFLCSPSSGVMDPFRNRERLRVEKWKGFPGNFFGFTKMLYLVAVLFFFFFRGKAAKCYACTYFFIKTAWTWDKLEINCPSSNVLKMGHLKKSIFNLIRYNVA